MTLWLESWQQVPAGSLPDSDRMLARLSQCDRWPKARAHSLRGWVPCSDGRLYHPVVCEKALEAWIEKLSNSLSGAAGNAKRWGVAIDQSAIRAQFITAVEMLRAIAPQSRALKKKVVAVILAGSPPDNPPESPRDGNAASPPDSGPDRKGQGQGQGQGEGIERESATPRAATASPHSRGVRLPAGWIPEPVHMAFAESLGLRNGKATAELEKFRDYWAAQPGQKGVKTDWPATWRNWVRRAVESQVGKPGAAPALDLEGMH